MFNVTITDTLYNRVIAAEKQKDGAARSYLYKLMKRQPVQRITAEDTANLKIILRDYSTTPPRYMFSTFPLLEAFGLQKSYGVMA